MDQHIYTVIMADGSGTPEQLKMTFDRFNRFVPESHILIITLDRFAQTARQVIIQGMREAEHNMIYESFSSKEHDMITGNVVRVDPRNGGVTVRLFSIYTGLTYYSSKKQLDKWTQGKNPKLLKTKRGQEYIYTEI